MLGFSFFKQDIRVIFDGNSNGKITFKKKKKFIEIKKKKKQLNFEKETLARLKI